MSPRYFHEPKRRIRLLLHVSRQVEAHWLVLATIRRRDILFSGAIGGFVTYILPTILFFFLRQSNEQTPNEATKYLSIIAFYGYVFWLLSSLIWISESCLIAVTLGDNLWKLRQRLARLQSFHLRRLRHDQIAGIKFESSDLIQISKLRIIVPEEFEQRVLQSNINLIAKRGESVLVSGSTGCGKTSLFRICAGLWPIDAELVRLPARKQTIYIPQRPYLPIGSLRFQALFLLDIRCGRSVTLNIDDKQIRDLFQHVNMDYLIDRYDLDTVRRTAACPFVNNAFHLFRSSNGRRVCPSANSSVCRSFVSLLSSSIVPKNRRVRWSCSTRARPPSIRRPNRLFTST